MMRAVLSGFMILISGLPLSGSDGYKKNPLVDILHYDFSVSVNDSNNVIYCRSAITVGFLGDVSSIELDLKNIKPDGKGMVVDSAFYNNGAVAWRHKDDKIRISLDKHAEKGEQCVVRIVSHGVPSDGLIISNNKFGSRTFFSDNWPDRASNYLPCIDHPSDKATVDFFITAPSHYEVVASGHLAEVRHLPGDFRLTHWKETVPLPAKVMAFGAADFDMKFEGDIGNVPVWTYVFRENGKEGFYDYSAAVKPMQFYSQLIGPYSFEKLANVQSRTIFGGLENAGCIFYAENSVTGKGDVEDLLAHEIAHQWFGNSVTENDWHHIWLSEGFATYLTSVYEEKTYGRERLDAGMKSARERVLKFWSRSPLPVIDTTVTDLMGLLNANSYQKGAWVLHMLRRETGDDNFWKGIRLFYERFRNGNVLTDDFKDVMEEVSRKDLDCFFRQWLYVAGQPDLKITGKPSARAGRTDIVIEQMQEHLFRFPLELKIICADGEQRVKVEVSDRITTLTIKAVMAKEIITDPDVNLLFRMVKD